MINVAMGLTSPGTSRRSGRSPAAACPGAAQHRRKDVADRGAAPARATEGTRASGGAGPAVAVIDNGLHEELVHGCSVRVVAGVR